MTPRPVFASPPIIIIIITTSSLFLPYFWNFEPWIRYAHKFRARCETRSARGCPPPIGGRTVANFAETMRDVPQGAWERGQQRRIDAGGSRRKEVTGGERYKWQAGDSACTLVLQLEPTSCWTRVIRDGQEAVIGHCQWSRCSHHHRVRKGRYLLVCKSPCWKHRSHRERKYFATAQCRRSFADACNHYPGDIREQQIV